MQAKFMGVSSSMRIFDFFGLVLGELVLDTVTILVRPSSLYQVCAAEGQKVAEETVTTLQDNESEADFNQFWSKVTKWPLIVKWRIQHYCGDERDPEDTKMALL